MRIDQGKLSPRGAVASCPARATRHVLHALALSMLLAAAGGNAEAAPPQRSIEGPWAKGQVLAMPRAGLSGTEVARILGPLGARAQRVGSSNLLLVKLPEGASEKAVVAQLARNPHFKFAELDRIVAPDATANDPYAGSAWHLNTIRAALAWDAAQGSGVTIAILDSGVDPSHPDLAVQLVPGWNVYDNNSNTADVQGHGTAVAGAAAAATNNAVGVAAVAGSARIMPVRITDTSGYALYSTIASGLTWAADRGAKIANVSIGGACGSASVQSAAQYMKGKGGLVFASAGNDGVEKTYGATTSLISVSATNSSDVKTSWSNFGSYVALAAPGQDIWTTTMGGGYGAWWGTSFAAPVSAGVAALVMSANPRLSNLEVESLLFSTAVDLGAAGKDAYYGYGRVDAAAAVAAAIATVSTSDGIAPVVSLSNPLASSTVAGVVPVDLTATDNVAVAKVELRVNGALVASDTIAPFAFSWDTTKVANGAATLSVTAYDAAGNTASSSVSVNVGNVVAVDTQPPVVAVVSPGSNTLVGSAVTVTTSASDNSGAAGITQSLYLDGRLVLTATGGSLSYRWNTRKLSSGAHTIEVTARDAAGNTGTSSVQVRK